MSQKSTKFIAVLILLLGVFNITHLTGLTPVILASLSSPISQPISSPVTPTPTPVSSPITPTPVPCNQPAKLSLSNQNVQSVLPGGSVANDLIITNPNPSSCGYTLYGISKGYPAGWTMSTPYSIVVYGGQTNSFPFSLTSSDTATQGVYSYTLYANGGNGVTGNVNVVSPITLPEILSANFDSSEDGFIASDFWHTTDRRYQSPQRSFWYGQDLTGNYDNGTANKGILISPSFYTPTNAPTLTFNSYFVTEDNGTFWDRKTVEMSVDGGVWTEVYQVSGVSGQWVNHKVSLPVKSGNNVQVRFKFDTVDGVLNNFEGWYIDDVKVKSNPNPVFSGSLGYWKMDEASGSDLADRLGHYHALGFDTSAALGKLGNARSFNGLTSKVNAGSPIALDNLSQVSASAWVYPKSEGENGRGVIMAKAVGGNFGGWFLRFAPDGTNALLFESQFTKYMWRKTVNNAISLNSWNHLVLTWDGTPNASNVHIFVNGVEVGYSVTQSGSGTRADDGSGNLLIGDNATGFASFDGVVDEVGIWGRVLSASETASLYNGGAGLTF